MKKVLIKEDREDSYTKTVITLVKEAGYTIQDLAEVLGYDRSTIRERKNKPQLFTIREILIIAELIKKTPTAVVKVILRELRESENSTILELEKQAGDFIERKTK